MSHISATIGLGLGGVHFMQRLLLLLSSLFALGCVASPEPGVTDVFSFIVIGDTPYTEEDLAMLDAATQSIKAEGAPFIVHIGDYKGGGQPCVAEYDNQFSTLLDNLAPIPVFYTPGDNEWTDCDRFDDPETGEKYSELDRLMSIREQFFDEPPSPAVASLAYSRHPEQPENAMWRADVIQFATLHVTGTNNSRKWVAGDPLERALQAVTARDAANIEWLRGVFEKASKNNAAAIVIATHGDLTDVKYQYDDLVCQDVVANGEHPCDAFADLRATLRDEAISFGKPVLVIHGDTAPFTISRDFNGEEAPNLWRLNAAGDAGVNRFGVHYGVPDITRVFIDLESDEPFSAQGVTTGAKPKRR